MIFTCSNCMTRFFVDGGSFGAAPRKVRCGNCGHVWVQTPLDNDPETFSASAVRRRSPPPELEAGGGVRWGVVAGWVLFVVAVVAVAYGAYHYRERIVAEWPNAAGLYRVAGIEVESSGVYGLDLELDSDQVRRGEENGTPVVFVSGFVLNTTRQDRDVPPVRLMLLNTRGEVVQETVFDVDTRRLPAGERAPFETRIADPNPEATRLRLVFDDR